MKPSPYHLHNCKQIVEERIIKIPSCQFLLESLPPWNCTRYDWYNLHNYDNDMTEKNISFWLADSTQSPEITPLYGLSRFGHK